MPDTVPATRGKNHARFLYGPRVGNEIRQWEEGKLLVFDDTIEHEAWNESAEDRIVLIFDIWRPELSEQERREVTVLFRGPEIA